MASHDRAGRRRPRRDRRARARHRNGRALARADLTAAETALAEALAPLPLTDRPAAATACTSMIRALLRHPPFPGHRKPIAVAAGLQLLAVNGWQADLDPPEAAIVIECLASGRIAPADAAAWLSARLSPCTAPRISVPRIRIRETLTRLPLRGPGGAGMSVNGRMVARFSDRAATAIFLARQETRRLGHDSIDPEHLLLGLIRVEDGGGLAALDRLGISPEALRQQVEGIIGHGPGTPDGPIRPSRPRGQKVLNSALPEALAHGTTDIRDAHMLLAQFHDDGPASQALGRLGATEERVRDTVTALRAQASRHSDV